MIIHNILMRYGALITALLILENLLMLGLIFYSLYYYIDSRKKYKSLESSNRDIDKYYANLEQLAYELNNRGDCKK